MLYCNKQSFRTKREQKAKPSEKVYVILLWFLFMTKWNSRKKFPPEKFSIFCRFRHSNYVLVYRLKFSQIIYTCFVYIVFNIHKLVEKIALPFSTFFGYIWWKGSFYHKFIERVPTYEKRPRSQNRWNLCAIIC